MTELGGEWRFASAVSKRMAHLGALTKGDRRAATGTDLHRFDIDSIFGRRALSIAFSALAKSQLRILAATRKTYWTSFLQPLTVYQFVALRLMTRRETYLP